MEHPGHDLLHRRAHRNLNEPRMVRAIVARSPLLGLPDPFGAGSKDDKPASGANPSSTAKSADDLPVSVPPISAGVNVGGTGKDAGSTAKPPPAGGPAGSTSKTDPGDTTPKTGTKATTPPGGTGTANGTGGKPDPSGGSTGTTGMTPPSGGSSAVPDFDMPPPSGGTGAGSDPGSSPGYDMPAPSGGINAGTNPGSSSSPSTTPPSGSSPANHTTGTDPNAAKPPPSTSTPAPAPANSTTAANSTSTHTTPASTPAPTTNTTATNTTASTSKPKDSAANATVPKNATETTPQVIQIIQSTPAPTPNASTIDSGPPAGGSAGTNSENGTGIGVIIGGIAGGLAGVIILIWLILIPVRRRQARQKDVDWALAFDNDKDHGPSENSADVIYGLQSSRAMEKNDTHRPESVVMGDVNRSQSDAYAQSEAAMQAYAQYSASDHHSGATQWVDPRGHAYSASQGQMYQDYPYETQQQPGAYFQPPNPGMGDPYAHLSPPQGPMAFYGHPEGMHGYGGGGGAVSPPSSSAAPLFPVTVQRGHSMSSSSSKSPSSGPLIHKNNSFSGGGASTLHEEYEGDPAHGKLGDAANPDDDLYGGVAAPIGHH